MLIGDTVPKELIHFTIAERTAGKLSDTRFAPDLKQEPNALLLGSVLHDALFYAATPGGKELESLAHKIHGAQGQDTFDIIRLQAAHACCAKEKPLPTALLVGLVSHLFADVVMHPMVYHFTGDYYADDPAAKSLSRQRHRALESLMDLVACPKKIGRASYLLRHLLRRCPNLIKSGLPMDQWSAMTGTSRPEVARQLKRAWKLFSWFQSASQRTALAWTLFAMRPYSPRPIAELSMLFYAPQLKSQADFLSGKIHFAHPVTGETITSTLDTLMNKAADKAANLCRRLEASIYEGTDINLPEPGPSMDAGISGISTKAMLHFADSPFPVLN